MTKTRVLILGILGIFISYAFEYLFSSYSNFGLSQDIYRGTYKSIFFLSSSIIIIWLLLIFVREEVFRAWIRFAYWWIPLSVIVIFLAAGSGGGSWGIPNIFDQETVSFILSGLFALISLLIILWKHFGHKSAARTGL